MDGMLSQEEINALLSGEGGINSNDSSSSNNIVLTDIEKDAIGEIANINMGTAATTLFSLVNKKVVITTPVVSIITWDDIASRYERPCVFIRISYTVGIDGSNILVLKENDVKIITDLMMGGDGTNTDGDLSELHLSAISEAMNQMMGSSATSLSTMLDKKIDISPPVADVVNLTSTVSGEEIDPFLGGEFVKISFKMEIGDLVDSEIMQLYPLQFAKELYESYQTVMYAGVDAELGGSQAEAEPEQQAVSNQMGMDMSGQMGMGMPQMGMDMSGQMGMGMPQMGMDMSGQMGMGMPQMGMGMPQMGMGMPQMGMGMPQMAYGMPNQYMQQPVNIQSAQFKPFTESFSSGGQSENISLIMDVPLEVTVELGRTSKSIQEILDFAPGTIIELNKIAGEPIDVLVNGKYVAKGEVVVIEESFGVRVTEIIKE